MIEERLSKLTFKHLDTMYDGLSHELNRLAFAPELQEVRDREEWPHAAHQACRWFQEAIVAEMKTRGYEYGTIGNTKRKISEP